MLLQIADTHNNYKAQITLSATKETKHQQYQKMCKFVGPQVCVITDKTFQDKQLFSFLTVLSTRAHNNGYNFPEVLLYELCLLTFGPVLFAEAPTTSS